MANKKYKILEIDPWLEPFEGDINLRMNKYYETRYDLVGENSLESFANGYMFFGFSRTKDGWIYREWAPGADEMHLIGDFNDWDRRAHPMHRTESGIWEVKIKGRDKIKHGQKIKVQITRHGRKFDRIPLRRRPSHTVQSHPVIGFLLRLVILQSQYVKYDYLRRLITKRILEKIVRLPCKLLCGTSDIG